MVAKRIKAAFSCSGEGFGHASRTTAVCQKLRNQIDIVFFCPETIRAFVQSQLPGIEVYPISFLKLVKKHHTIQFIQTGLANIPKLFFGHREVAALAAQLQDLEIEVVVSDYDPILPKAARKAGIPVVAFNHQGILNRFRSFSSITAIMAQLSNWTMMPTYDRLITSSFYDGDVGPILRERIHTPLPTLDYIFVYTKPTFFKKIAPLLSLYPTENFRLFPSPTLDFLDGIKQSKAVIAPAGHQLISECLVLKKPLFVVPEKKQYEQQLNAQMLESSGRGVNGASGELEAKFKWFMAHYAAYPREIPVSFTLRDQNDLDAATELLLSTMKELLD